MIYLNVILTILCVILISFLILALYLVKEYKNKIKNFPTQLNTDWRNTPNFGNKEEIDNMTEIVECYTTPDTPESYIMADSDFVIL
jgi:predicted Holliday junction resolvase-like endonuclease